MNGSNEPECLTDTERTIAIYACGKGYIVIVEPTPYGNVMRIASEQTTRDIALDQWYSGVTH